MRQDEKVETRRKPPRPGKLLQVLVAAGMALAGATGARAQEKPAPSGDKTSAPADASDQAKQKAKDAEAKKKAEEEKAKKKKAEEQKKAEEAGGVKGW